MDITVIISVKNGANTISDQINALINQKTKYEWELIISDNGCTDDTVKIVESLLKNVNFPYKILDSSTYPGVSGARNVGIANSSGNFIAFCDADDQVFPGWIETIGNHSEEADILGGPLYDLDSKVALRRDSILYTRTDEGSFIGCNVAIRKSLLLLVGGFDWGMPRYGGEDTEIAIRLNEIKSKFLLVDDMKIYFRETKGVISKIKKIINANMAEVEIWRRYPKKFNQDFCCLWSLRASFQAVVSVMELLREKKYSLAFRYSLKPPVFLYYMICRKSNDVKFKYISDMN